MRVMLRKFALGLSLVALPVSTASAQIVGRMTPAEPLTEARVKALPAGEQAAWLAYLARSRARLAADKAALAAERRGGSAPAPVRPGPSGGGGMPLDRQAEWYAGAEARRVADNIVSFQTPAGGWGKNVDRSGPPRLPGQHYVPVEKLSASAASDIQADADWRYVGTFDNNATTLEMRFLARVQAQLAGAAGERYRAAFLKGVRYLLDAQFPNGGWPQVYPLQGGYHDAITYNDNAVAQVATLLSAVARREGDYGFVPTGLAAEAKAACARAVDVVLRTQVRIEGKRTVWGQQHDALTLAPVAARNFEPVALSSDESADLLLFLMEQPNPSAQIRAAVADGVAWLEARALRDVAWVRAEGRLEPKPGAGPLWSRYYDLKTFQPIFGDRDRTINNNVNNLSEERRKGYSWFNTAPAKAIKTFRAWSTR
jgi:PelA/Pel-15E family pectate lyase